MYRALAVLSLVLFVFALGRSADNSVSIGIGADHLRLDSRTHVVAFSYGVSNPTWDLVFVPTAGGDSAVIIEHRLGGVWLSHARLEFSCVARSLRRLHEPLRHDETCAGSAVLHVPGYYRLRVRYSASRRGPWRSAVSRAFRVVLPPAPPPPALAA